MENESPVRFVVTVLILVVIGLLIYGAIKNGPEADDSSEMPFTSTDPLT